VALNRKSFCIKENGGVENLVFFPNGDLKLLGFIIWEGGIFGYMALHLSDIIGIFHGFPKVEGVFEL